MGRRAAVETTIETEPVSDEPNGEGSAETRPTLTSAQRLAASTASSNEVSPDPFGKEAKHFTEIRVLHREVSKFILSNDFPFLLLIVYGCFQVMMEFTGPYCTRRCRQIWQFDWFSILS